MRFSHKKKGTVKKAILYLVLSTIAAIMAFPLFWVLFSSIKSSPEMVTGSPMTLPKTITLENYVKLLTPPSAFSTHFTNSLVVATSVSLLTLFFAGIPAYGISRLLYRFKNQMRQLMSVTYMFPPIMFAMAFLKIFAPLNLYDTYPGIILAHLTFTVPFALLMYVPYFDSIPRELDDAATLDGASRIRTFISIILPAALPGVISTTIFSWILSWSDFTYSLILLKSTAKLTATVSLQIMATQRTGLIWDTVLPATALMTLIPIIAFAFLEERLIKGLGIMY